MREKGEIEREGGGGGTESVRQTDRQMPGKMLGVFTCVATKEKERMIIIQKLQ